jgi:hypothetical protein
VLDIDGHPELGEEWSNVANPRISASVRTSKQLQECSVTCIVGEAWTTVVWNICSF